jgi:hypothetical protein
MLPPVEMTHTFLQAKRLSLLNIRGVGPEVGEWATAKAGQDAIGDRLGAVPERSLF